VTGQRGVDGLAGFVDCAAVTHGWTAIERVTGAALRAGIVAVAVISAGSALAACQGPPVDATAVRDDEVAHHAGQLDERVAEGAFTFGQYCALCHGADATGYVADHAPSLVSPTFLESVSDDQLARGIREGRPGTAMAGYARSRGGPLDDDSVAAIIAFLRDQGPAHVRLPTAPVLGDAAGGEVVWAASCQRCHGTHTERGSAVHLGNASFLSGASDAFLRHAVVHGRPGTPMPAFDGALGEPQIDDVVAMLRAWATPPAPERRAPPEPPPLGQVVINPGGKTPDFTLRADRFVPIDDVKRALDAKMRLVIIDARPASDWYVMHIPGSISVPYYMLTRLDAMPKDKDSTWITAYCACPHHASGTVVDELRKRGFTHTAILDEGILEWKKRGYPTASEPEEGAAPKTPPPRTPVSAAKALVSGTMKR
jgi:cytochrome c oxidase cbb3-type subunit 3